MLGIPSNFNLPKPRKFAMELAKHDVLDKFDSRDVKQILCVCYGKTIIWKLKSVSVNLFD
jgi:hypothetical protein